MPAPPPTSRIDQARKQRRIAQIERCRRAAGVACRQRNDALAFDDEYPRHMHAQTVEHARSADYQSRITARIGSRRYATRYEEGRKTR